MLPVPQSLRHLEDSPVRYVLYAGRAGPERERVLVDCAQHAPRLRFDVVESDAQGLARLPALAGTGPVPDLLLVDCQSPGVTVREIARTLRDRVGLDVPMVPIGDADDGVAAATQMGLSVCVITKRDGPGGLPVILENAARQAQLRQKASSVPPVTARLNLVLSAGPTILYAFGVDGQHLVPLWVSDNVTRLMSFSPAECLVPDWWVSHLYEADRARVLDTWPRLLAERSLVQENRFRDGQGAVRWLRDPVGAPRPRLLPSDVGQPDAGGSLPG